MPHVCLKPREVPKPQSRTSTSAGIPHQSKNIPYCQYLMSCNKTTYMTNSGISVWFWTKHWISEMTIVLSTGVTLWHGNCWHRKISQVLVKTDACKKTIIVQILIIHLLPPSLEEVHPAVTQSWRSSIWFLARHIAFTSVLSFRASCTSISAMSFVTRCCPYLALGWDMIFFTIFICADSLAVGL